MSLHASEWISVAQTLVYVATFSALIWQTRENVKAVRSSQYQSALQMMFDVRSEIIRDPTLLGDAKEDEYFEKAYAIFGKKGYYYKLKLFHAYEVLYILYSSEVIDEQLWKGWRSNIQVTLKSQANRELWKQMKSQNLFNEDFSKLVDELI